MTPGHTAHMKPPITRFCHLETHKVVICVRFTGEHAPPAGDFIFDAPARITSLFPVHNPTQRKRALIYTYQRSFSLHVPPTLEQLFLDNVCSLKSFRTLDDIECHFIAIGEGFEAFPLDSGEMYEHIVAAIMLDETEALGVVKPLYSAFCQL